ncbi:MAG: carboxypeptidase-like regulatory domain-containing protein [Bacteroidales bacterium]|nr:carboxypeptidase-like regulatory domain-containing protein [Bacteroidales bacterium]
MRHLTLFFVLTLFASLSIFAQTGSVQGNVIDGKTTEPIENIFVQVDGTSIEVYTNEKGEFLLNNVPIGMGTLVFTGKDFEPKNLEFSLASGELLQIGSVTLKYLPELNVDSDELPMITLEESDFDDDGLQSAGGILQSSGDVFSDVAAYTFGAARFRVRGYDSENSAIFFNGIDMNNMEKGRPYYSDWGGLNDVQRNKEYYYGNDNNELSLSYIGGGANVITRASEYRPGIKTSYMSRMSNYRNRLMITGSTGLMNNGWAVTLSGSRRWAEEGYVDGTFYDSWSYFLAAEKIINEKHSISLTAFATPNKRGKQIGSTQETYDLTGSNYYNANWGYQDGEKRNARVANTWKPYFIVNHLWDINEKMDLSTSVSYTFGRSGATALTWADAKDPRPNYYRNLPYYNRNDEFYEGWIDRQVQWDDFYQANSDEYYLVENLNGIDGNDYMGIRSKYMVEDRREDHTQIMANMKFDYAFSDQLKLMANASYTSYKNRHYKLVDDLLGGEFWYDIDKFALGDVDNPDELQSDLNNPNRIAREGDAFGYDYESNINKINGFVKADYTIDNFDIYLAGGVSSTSFYRTGNMKVGKFPSNSYGDSEKQEFLNYNVAGGLTYKITGRHIVYVNGSYMTRAPYFEDAYVSPRTRDNVIDGLTSEKIMSFDANYLARLPFLTARLSGYYTTFEDQVDVMSFYHDGYSSFVNYAMTGIDKKHFGMELGLEGKVTSSITLSGAAALGQHTWDSRPNVSITRDNDSESLATNETVYVQDYRVDGSPQTALTLGIEYRSPKFWWVKVNGTYFDDIYLSFNPARRTLEAVEGLDADSDLTDQILSQEKLGNGYVFNVLGGKSWKIDKYYISLFANISNVLDNRDLKTGGYEQLRFDYDNKDVNKYPANYFYMYGRSYMLILTLSF